MHTRTILLLENEPERRQQMHFLLKLAGYRVRPVATVEEASNWLTTCAGAADDFLCLLVNSPGPATAAARLVEQCRACGLHLPVLLVSRGELPSDRLPEARRQLDCLGVHVSLPDELTPLLQQLATAANGSSPVACRQGG